MKASVNTTPPSHSLMLDDVRQILKWTYVKNSQMCQKRKEKRKKEKKRALTNVLPLRRAGESWEGEEGWMGRGRGGRGRCTGSLLWQIPGNTTTVCFILQIELVRSSWENWQVQLPFTLWRSTSVQLTILTLAPGETDASKSFTSRRLLQVLTRKFLPFISWNDDWKVGANITNKYIIIIIARMTAHVSMWHYCECFDGRVQMMERWYEF